VVKPSSSPTVSPAVQGGLFPAPRGPEGLSGPAGELPWLGQPLARGQEAAFDRARVPLRAQPDEGATRLLLREDAAVTAEALIALQAHPEAGDLAWAAGGRSGALALELAFSDPGPLLVRLAPGGPITPTRIAAARRVEIDPKERLLRFDVPRSQFGVDAIELPLSDRLVLPCGHWLQLLWANLLALGPFLWRELIGQNPLLAIPRLLWAWLRARSFDPKRIGAQLGRRGARCRVHPTAVVEGSWLGDDVTIGALAVVRGCVLADGAIVEELAHVEGSFLAPGAAAQRMALVKYTVLREGAAGAGAMQMSVLDRGAAVKYNALLMDQVLRGSVRVQSGGGLHKAPFGLAGVCVGEGTLIAAAVLIAPGRALPPGLLIVPDPDSVVGQIPAGLSGRVTARHGRLEPL
jgi:hypothetical protein